MIEDSDWKRAQDGFILMNWTQSRTGLVLSAEFLSHLERISPSAQQKGFVTVGGAQIKMRMHIMTLAGQETSTSGS